MELSSPQYKSNGIIYGYYAIMIILQNNYWEIWTTHDLSPVALSQSMDNYYSASTSIKHGRPSTHKICNNQKVSQITENLR